MRIIGYNNTAVKRSSSGVSSYNFFLAYTTNTLYITYDCFRKSGIGELDKKRVKVGLSKGSGPPPGYKRSAFYLSVAFDEATSFLTQERYEYLVDHVRALALEDDPLKPKTVSIDKIEDVFEMRVKGGPLGRINVRVFFFINNANEIIILGCRQKQNDRRLPQATYKLMSVRKRKYLSGAYES